MLKNLKGAQTVLVKLVMVFSLFRLVLYIF